MASCPKCGKHIKRKGRDGLKKCKRHGYLSSRVQSDADLKMASKTITVNGEQNG